MQYPPNQDPNQPSQYGGYPPQQPSDPYSGQQAGYGQQPYGQGQQQQQPPPYGQQQPPYGQQQYGQPGYQQPYGTGAPYGGAAASPLGPTSMGMDAKTAAGLSYVLTWITGLIFFFMEKQNRFVRFHAMQSILFFGGLTVLSIVFSVIWQLGIPFLGLLAFCVSGLLWIVWLVGWIVLMINGFQGKYFKLPVIGDYAEKYANQGTL